MATDLKRDLIDSIVTDPSFLSAEDVEELRNRLKRVGLKGMSGRELQLIKKLPRPKPQQERPGDELTQQPTQQATQNLPGLEERVRGNDPELADLREELFFSLERGTARDINTQIETLFGTGQFDQLTDKEFDEIVDLRLESFGANFEGVSPDGQ